MGRVRGAPAARPRDAAGTRRLPRRSRTAAAGGWRDTARVRGAARAAPAPRRRGGRRAGTRGLRDRPQRRPRRPAQCRRSAARPTGRRPAAQETSRRARRVLRGPARGTRAGPARASSAALAYDQASEHFNRGEVEEAAACLRSAARDPLFRFRAASMLARIARDQRRVRRGGRVARARGRGAGADDTRPRTASSTNSATSWSRRGKPPARWRSSSNCRRRRQGTATSPTASRALSRRQAGRPAREGPAVSVLGRLLFLAYFVEVGLVLLVVPWSPFWDRNYFVDLWPALPTVTRSNLVRGAVSGLGRHQPVGRHGRTGRAVRHAIEVTASGRRRRRARLTAARAVP